MISLNCYDVDTSKHCSQNQKGLGPYKATANSTTALIYASSVPTLPLPCTISVLPFLKTLFSSFLNKRRRQVLCSGRIISHKFLEDSSMWENQIKMTVITFPPQVSHRNVTQITYMPLGTSNNTNAKAIPKY